MVVWWTDGKAWSEGTANRDYQICDTRPQARVGLVDAEGHPCPRPLLQVQHIVEQWVRPESVALDPFMGSGTTGVACVRTGRKFIGIEIEERYCAIAKRRIQEAFADQALFARSK